MNANYITLAKINVELFYAVTIYTYGVRLQGEQSSETIKYLKKVYDVSDWTVDANGFMIVLFEIDGVKVDVTLT
jgi:hypothetical protein